MISQMLEIFSDNIYVYYIQLKIFIELELRDILIRQYVIF